MRCRKSLLLVWCWASSLTFPAAAEGPRIASDNAHLVQSIAETPKLANRILLGPQPGELTIYGYSTPLEIVDDTNFRTLRKINDGFMPIDFARSRDGKFLTWTERNSKSYFLLDVPNNKTTEIDLGDSPGDAAFSPDGKLLAIGKTYWDPKGDGSGESAMLLFDMSGNLIRTLEKSGLGGLRPTFSPDGKTIAVGNRNEETRLFDVATGKRLTRLPKSMTQEIAFSPDGKTLAASYVDGTLALWSVPDGKLLHAAHGECEELYSVSWNPTGDVLATSGLNGKIILWGAEMLTKLVKFDAPAWVIQVRFTADGTRLLAASSSAPTSKPDRKIVTYSVRPGQE